MNFSLRLSLAGYRCTLLLPFLLISQEGRQLLHAFYQALLFQMFDKCILYLRRLTMSNSLYNFVNIRQHVVSLSIF